MLLAPLLCEHGEKRFCCCCCRRCCFGFRASTPHHPCSCSLFSLVLCPTPTSIHTWPVIAAAFLMPFISPAFLCVCAAVRAHFVFSPYWCLCAGVEKSTCEEGRSGEEEEEQEEGAEPGWRMHCCCQRAPRPTSSCHMRQTPQRSFVRSSCRESSACALPSSTMALWTTLSTAFPSSRSMCRNRERIGLACVHVLLCVHV